MCLLEDMLHVAIPLKLQMVKNVNWGKGAMDTCTAAVAVLKRTSET